MIVDNDLKFDRMLGKSKSIWGLPKRTFKDKEPKL